MKIEQIATATLRRTLKGPKPIELGWKCIADFVNLCYHPEDSRPNFVVRWRNALEGAQQELGVLNNHHIYHHFIIAIRSTDITNQWRNYLELDPNAIDQNVLEEAYAQFIASERCSLSTSQYQTPLFLSASVNREDNEPQFCEFHKRKVYHSHSECFLNPANADKLDATNTWRLRRFRQSKTPRI